MKKIIFTILIALTALPVFAGNQANSQFIGTFWALFPPLIAILLALITKEVFFSLFTGIVLGGLFVGNLSPLKSMDAIVKTG